jgi:hypothetical protein
MDILKRAVERLPGGVFHWAGRLIVAAALAVLTSPGTVNAGVDRVDEYQVKAAFLFNFAKFVNWADDPAAKPLVVGIVGEDPFGDTLDQLVRGKTVAGRGIVVQRFSHGDDLGKCNIVFVSASEGRRTPEILRRIGDGPILTVGETPQFLREGGLVRFYIDGNKVRFQINKQGAEQSGIRISSQLLSLAR